MPYQLRLGSSTSGRESDTSSLLSGVLTRQTAKKKQNIEHPVIHLSTHIVNFTQALSPYVLAHRTAMVALPHVWTMCRETSRRHGAEPFSHKA